MTNKLSDIHIRDARDDDAEGLITLIGDVFAEYPGCVMDVDGELPELRSIASTFARWGGRFWVAERDGKIVACVGMTPSASGSGVELRKLYVQKSERKAGLGSGLCDLVEHEAMARGAPFIDLWSDTRFDRAHALYERRGYVRGPTRALHDKSESIEYYFRRELPPGGLT